MAPTLPVGLAVAGWRCLVVGAGPVGARRARALAEAGAVVEVVAPTVSAAVRDLARAGTVRVHERAVDAGRDVVGVRLVVCATDDRSVNASVADAARVAGALVNRADDASASDVVVAAVVPRGPVRVAVLGDPDRPAPAVTRWLAARLEERLDDVVGLDADGLGLLVDVVAEVRGELAAAGASGGPGVTPAVPDWRRGLDSTMLELISRGRRAEAKDHLLACLSSS